MDVPRQYSICPYHFTMCYKPPELAQTSGFSGKFLISFTGLGATLTSTHDAIVSAWGVDVDRGHLALHVHVEVRLNHVCLGPGAEHIVLATATISRRLALSEILLHVRYARA